MEGKTEEEVEMMKLMGFAFFDSTKGKKGGWLCKCLCHKCVPEEEVQVIHESKTWIQQTFGFHCMRIEMLKNDFSPHCDQMSGCYI